MFENTETGQWGYSVYAYGTGKFKHRKRPITDSGHWYDSKTTALLAAIQSEKLREYIEKGDF